MLSKRIAKKTLKPKDNVLEWSKTVADATVDEAVLGESSVPGRIRRLYTSSYKALDQFDQLWYEIQYDKRDHSWEICYIWAIILDCVINARAAHCELYEKKIPLKEFVRLLMPLLREYISKL